MATKLSDFKTGDLLKNEKFLVCSMSMKETKNKKPYADLKLKYAGEGK